MRRRRPARDASLSRRHARPRRPPPADAPRRLGHSARPPRPRKPPLLVTLRYVWVVARQFRWTLLALTAAVLLGGLLYVITPHAQLGGRRPAPLMALLSAWMALFAQPVLAPP